MNAKDKHGISVLLAAIWEGHTKCVEFLIQKVRYVEGGSMKLAWVALMVERRTHNHKSWVRIPVVTPEVLT